MEYGLIVLIAGFVAIYWSRIVEDEGREPDPGRTTEVFRVSWRIYAVLAVASLGFVVFFLIVAETDPPLRPYLVGAAAAVLGIAIFEGWRLSSLRIELNDQIMTYVAGSKSRELRLDSISSVSSSGAYLGVRTEEGPPLGFPVSYFQNGRGLARFLERCARKNAFEANRTKG